MKPIYTILPVIFSLLFISSCTDDNVNQPVAEISLSSTEVGINESVTIRFTGSADNVVIFPGDEGQNYDLLTQSNTGLVVNKGLLTYAYTTPGDYEIVCVATNHAKEGKIVLRDICRVRIHVIDEENRISKISAYPVVRDEIFATRLNDKDWLMAFPRNMRYQSSNPAVTMSRKLKIYTHSSSTSVKIDGADFSESKSYNLSTPLTIETTSHSGFSREYKLHTLYYGEFKSFKVAGVAGVIERDPFNYHENTITITVPEGTDVTALTPEFVLMAANEKVYVGDEEQVSGATVTDFSQPVTYRFVTTSDVDPEIKVESTCIVSVKN